MIYPEIVAIINLTPDSFSDGGRYNNIDLALSEVESLINDGANILDIGAESTRPGAIPISETEEWDRLKLILPKIVTLARKHNKLISLDTRNVSTAAKAINIGIDIINDVSNSKELQLLAIKNNIKIVIMHSLSVPADKTIVLDSNIAIADHIKKFAKDKIDELISLGAKLENIIFDPGIGFGKNSYQSFELIKNISNFTELNVEIMVGHSRKSLYNVFNKITALKDLETHITSIYLASQNIKYLRVHDVIGTISAIKLANILNITQKNDNI